MKFNLLFLAGFLLLTACAPLENKTPTPLKIYASPSASPWLETAYACAPQAGAVLRRVGSPDQADLRLKLGAPSGSADSAFVIGAEEIVVAANPKSALSLATAAAAREFFAETDRTVWVLDSADETRIFFEAEVMLGGPAPLKYGVPVTSLARLAASPQDLAQSLSDDENAVGVLGQHFAGRARVIFSAGHLPVLAETTSLPAGVLRSLLACMQKISPTSLPPQPAG